MVQIQPFGNRIVIKVIQSDENIVGGLIIATSNEKSNKGEVVGVGDGEEVRNIKIGDIVIFNTTSGMNYSSEEGDYKVLQIRDVIGKII